jgi:ribosomal protein L7/L12
MSDNPALHFLDDTPEELLELIRAGRKIEAVKWVKDRTDAGIAQSKAVVDELDARLADPDGSFAALAGHGGTDGDGSPDREYLDDIPREIQDLLYEGRKIEAIKRVREQSGKPLKFAKSVVDQMHEKMAVKFGDKMKGPGCAAALLIGAVIVGAFL